MNQKNKTRQFTISSMLSALGTLFLCIAAIIPTGSGTLMLLAGGMIAVIVCECEMRYAVISFVAVSLLTLILAADKAVPLIYICCVGSYPIAKLYIERLRKRKIEYLIKAVIGIVEGFLWYFISKLFEVPIEWYWIPICIVAVLAYDFVLNLMIDIYCKKIKKRIK